MLLALLLSFQSFGFDKGAYYKGQDLEPISRQEIASQIRAGDIVVIGELHNEQLAAENQMAFLKLLRKNAFQVSVGMEFLDFTKQSSVDRYRAGQITEAQFLKESWGGDNFNFYREQILFPEARWGEQLIALNAPRSLTSQVARGGLDSLSEADKKLLPPNFAVGNPGYLERFKGAIGHVSDPVKLNNYFVAQSIWDDTMAYNAISSFQAQPNQTLVIIVGQFHAQYGGGLPDRILARGFKGRVWTIMQYKSQGQTDAQIRANISPSSRWGTLADYIWVY